MLSCLALALLCAGLVSSAWAAEETMDEEGTRYRYKNEREQELEKAKLEDMYLGSTQIQCKKQLRLHAQPSVYYPLGKTEKISVAVPSEVVVFECGYRRGRMVCANHTSRIEFQRLTSRGAIYVKCFGILPMRRGLENEEGEDGAEGQAEPGAEGAAGAGGD